MSHIQETARDTAACESPVWHPGQIEVRRSPKRRRTVSARREGPKTVVFIPARFSVEEEQQWVAEMMQRLDASDRRTGSGATRGEAALMQRAGELSLQYLAGAAVPVSVRWVGNQHQRWGSCTPEESSIRLSNRLQSMPGYVVDFVLLHELAHLIEPGHGAPFRSLVAGFLATDKAQGYLDGFAAGQLVAALVDHSAAAPPSPVGKRSSTGLAPPANSNSHQHSALGPDLPALW